jgi:hypothetical protein
MLIVVVFVPVTPSVPFGVERISPRHTVEADIGCSGVSAATKAYDTPTTAVKGSTAASSDAWPADVAAPVGKANAVINCVTIACMSVCDAGVITSVPVEFKMATRPILFISKLKYEREQAINLPPYFQNVLRVNLEQVAEVSVEHQLLQILRTTKNVAFGLLFAVLLDVYNFAAHRRPNQSTP